MTLVLIAIRAPIPPSPWTWRLSPLDTARRADTAQRTMAAAEDLVRTAKLRAGLRPEPEVGADPSGLIGDELTPLVTTLGNLEAKRVATNPLWARALVERLAAVGVGRGDLVAASFSGSFPGLNLAVMAACRALDTRLIAISSATASTWGADQPGFTWPEIEARVVQAGLLPRASIAVTAGGEADQALDLDPEGRAAARAAAGSAARQLDSTRPESHRLRRGGPPATRDVSPVRQWPGHRPLCECGWRLDKSRPFGRRAAPAQRVRGRGALRPFAAAGGHRPVRRAGRARVDAPQRPGPSPAMGRPAGGPPGVDRLVAEFLKFPPSFPITLQGLRVPGNRSAAPVRDMPERPIELGLARPLEHGLGPIAWLVDQLLDMISNQAADSQTLNTSTFRQRVKQFREDLQAEIAAELADRLTQDCATTCRDFFRRAAAFDAEREAEIKGLIDTLTTAIDKLAGEAVSVNKQLTGHTDRFHRLVDVEDIRELKRRISDEVTALNRFVAEKQEREEAYYSTLTKRIEVLQARLAETEEAAALDPLTQIPNRGTFDQTLRRWLARSPQAQPPFVLALFDIDDFKHVNDTYGHVVGDRVLLAAARTLSSQLRDDDVVARYGGEEFGLLMAGMTLRQAEPRLREMLACIASAVYEFDHAGQPEQLSYTMSAGAAEVAAADTSESIVKRADEGLYEAKRRGKNCVVCRKASLLTRFLGS